MTLANPQAELSVRTPCCPTGIQEIVTATVEVAGKNAWCRLVACEEAAGEVVWEGKCDVENGSDCGHILGDLLKIQLRCEHQGWRVSLNGGERIEAFGEQLHPLFLEFAAVPLDDAGGAFADVLITE